MKLGGNATRGFDIGDDLAAKQWTVAASVKQGHNIYLGVQYMELVKSNPTEEYIISKPKIVVLVQ